MTIIFTLYPLPFGLLPLAFGLKMSGREHMDKTKFNNIKEWQKFGFGLSLILAVIASIQLYLGSAAALFLYGAAAVLVLAALMFPLLIKPLFILFSYIGLAMNWLVTHLVLTIVFFLLITPLGWLLKLSGKKLLDRDFSGKPDSYWISREKEAGNREDFKNQY